MLKRTRQFLRNAEAERDENSSSIFPGLFLVLPGPCVMNSRYMDEDRLEAIMKCLGFTMIKKKISNKLIYYYWRYLGASTARDRGIGKEELRGGGNRNNFCIVLR